MAGGEIEEPIIHPTHFLKLKLLKRQLDIRHSVELKYKMA